MTIKAELGYMEYASICGPGHQLCDLPESIQDEIEEFMDGIDLVENPRYHPDELAVNYLQQFTKRDVVVHELGEREATEEEYIEHMKALAEEKIGIRMLLPEEIEQLKKEGRLKPLYEV